MIFNEQIKELYNEKGVAEVCGVINMVHDAIEHKMNTDDVAKYYKKYIPKSVFMKFGLDVKFGMEKEIKKEMKEVKLESIHELKEAFLNRVLDRTKWYGTEIYEAEIQDTGKSSVLVQVDPWNEENPGIILYRRKEVNFF